MHYYFLIDNPKGFSLAKSSRYPLEVVTTPTRKKKFISWLAGSYDSVRKSHRGDAIISWYDFQGILVYLLCRLTWRKREIFLINILLKKKNTLKNRLVRVLYKHALKDPHVHASVTSEYYGQWLNDMLGINEEYSLVRDVCYKQYFSWHRYATSIEKGTIFCGGGNARDWNFLFELAREMPDTKFYAVMRGRFYKDIKDRIPNNVEARHDISKEEFATLMNRSEVVCLPLETEAPAGLIVLFQVAVCKKPVFITKNSTTRAYVDDSRGYSLVRDVNTWKEALLHGFANPKEMSEKAENLYKFITSECSEEAFISQVDKMIEKYLGKPER